MAKLLTALSELWALAFCHLAIGASYEGGQLVAIDADWSAFRLRHVSSYLYAIAQAKVDLLSEETLRRANYGLQYVSFLVLVSHYILR